MSEMRKCFRCEAPIDRRHEVCPECRERQPGSAMKYFWMAGAVAVLTWVAFR